MKVLVACEYSGTVRDSFTELGHDAWSCDFEPSETPGNHYIGDVADILSEPWDLMIAHPPCERLCVSGARWKYEKEGWAKQQDEAIDFVNLLLNAPIPKIALENPIGIISTRIRKPDQVIQPWQFGIPETKASCLWLKNLKKLYAPYMENSLFFPEPPTERLARVHKTPPSKERKKLRAWRYKAIAMEMANQWGSLQ